MNQYDLLISGGSVVDGTGIPPVPANIAIKDGRIAAMGDIAPVADTPVLDAAGLLVAPGFIDIHSHSDFTLLVDPRGQFDHPRCDAGGGRQLWTWLCAVGGPRPGAHEHLWLSARV